MLFPLILVALIAQISSSFAAPAVSIAARSSSLVTRGRAFQELLAPDAPKPEFKTFKEAVDFHRKVIQPDLDQNFEQWQLDMTSEYWFQRSEFFRVVRGLTFHGHTYNTLGDVDAVIKDFDSEAATALSNTWDDTGFQHHLASWSEYTIELYLIWIMKRLSLLQTDVRPEIYKLMVNWAVHLHQVCEYDYTPYPTGFGAVIVQIQYIANMPDPKYPSSSCSRISYVHYDEEALAIYWILSKPEYFSTLQRLCIAAAKGCKFAISDVEPDFKPEGATRL